MKRILCVIIIFCGSITVSAVNLTTELDKIKQGEKSIAFELGNNQRATFIFDKTSKGNGTLLLGNYALLRIMDFHDDGAYYKNGRLRVDLTDISGDGVKDLVISGTVITADANGDVAEAPLFMIYRYDHNKFNRVYKQSPIEIDIALIK